jgi:HEAT repeat protein
LLVKALKAKDSFVRSDAYRTLGEMGPAAKEATDAHREGLKDKQFRVYAAECLWRINGKSPEALRVLRGALQDDNELVRFPAAKVLFVLSATK